MHLSTRYYAIIFDVFASAILLNNTENLAEELLDVIQCCYGIAYTRGINLEEHIRQHNKKLLSRGHNFID